MRTIAIFGAGPALGLSLATRFGREGYRVALVARRQESLDDLAARLGDVETATFVADLTDRAQLAAAVSAIEERFGHVDVATYSPGGLDQVRVPVLDLEPDVLAGQLDLLLLTPVALARLLVPGMRARGDGALLFASGTSAITPLPLLGNVGIALAGARNYVLNLNGALAGDGVYAGLVPIGGLIKGSPAERVIAESPEAFAGFDLAALERAALDPDDIAEVFWELNSKRDRPEQVVGDAI